MLGQAGQSILHAFHHGQQLQQSQQLIGVRSFTGGYSIILSKDHAGSVFVGHYQLAVPIERERRALDHGGTVRHIPGCGLGIQIIGDDGMTIFGEG